MNVSVYTEYLDSLNFRDEDTVCVSFGKDKGWIGDFFQPFSVLRTQATIDKLVARNEDGQNIYISMAPFVAGTKSRKKEFVAGVRHVFADADADGRAVLDKINADVVAGIMPDPAIGIESSPGKVQVIWQVNADFDIAKQEAINRAIQIRYNTDPQTVDTARVLRLPGFINHKYADKPESGILARGTRTAHALSTFKIEITKLEAHAAPRDANNLIPHGYIHDQLVSQCGKMASSGMPPGEAFEEALVAWAESNCCAPLDLGHVRQVARSTDHWKRSNPFAEIVLHGGVPVGTSPDVRPAAIVVPSAESAKPEIDTKGLTPYPEFPLWTLHGTTLFQGLVKPAVETSSKYAQLIYMPAIQIMLNHLFGRIRIKNQNVNLNMYLGLISPYGQFFKSSCCELAQKYFEFAGILESYKPSMRNANGHMIVMQAGSTEGFGKTISKLGGSHAILYTEELSKMVSKSGIESSSYSYDLLTWYGSGEWGNIVKSEKDSFSFPAGSYCFSWQWCTTDRGFNRQWPKIAGMASGMEDRLFFVLSPKEPRPTTPYVDPPIQEGARRTGQVIERAVQQAVFAYEDADRAAKTLNGLDPRSMQLVQMLALYFAVDMEEDCITIDCVERAEALVKYRQEVRAYLEPIEADTIQGRVQKEILRELKQAGGKMKYRNLCLNMDYGRFGSDFWSAAIGGMFKTKMLVQWDERTPKGQKAHWVGIPKHEDDD